MFGGHRPCGRGDIKFLICHEIAHDHVIRGLSSTCYKPPSCQGWWSEALCKRRYLVFSLSSDLTCPRGQRVTWHCKRVFTITSDYPAKFGDHRSCGRGNIKLSICHVIPIDQVVRRLCDIMGEFPSL